MNKQQQQRQQKRSSINNANSSSSSSLKLILPGVGIIALLFLGLSFTGHSTNNKLNLEKVELNPSASSAKKAQTEAPRYGLDDKTVTQNEAQIVLRDNGVEDGDYVTLYVNGQVYTQSVFIKNAGQSVLVPLNPGANLVQISGDRDGGGGVTLAADVAGQGNMTSSPMAVGSTASFYIIRK